MKFNPKPGDLCFHKDSLSEKTHKTEVCLMMKCEDGKFDFALTSKRGLRIIEIPRETIVLIVAPWIQENEEAWAACVALYEEQFVLVYTSYLKKVKK